MATAEERRQQNLVKEAGVTRYLPDYETASPRDAGAASGNIYGPSVGAAGRQFQLSYEGKGPVGMPRLDNLDIGTRGAYSGAPDYLTQLKAMASTSGSGGGGMSGANKLGYAELEYKRRKDAQDRQDALDALAYDRARDARVLGGMQDYYSSGQYGTGFDNLLKMIEQQGQVSQGGITDAYDRATTNIGQGYDAASGLGTTGFNALNQYLAQNQNNPYAGMQASVGSAPDALSNYLSAYGVSDQPVQGQIQADQLQAQQGAGNYQNLIDLLGANAQQGAASRGAESQMAQLLFNTGLGQERAGYQGQAANAQAQALAALQQQMFQSRFGVENDRNSLANQLAQQLITAGGNLNGGGTSTVTQPSVIPPATVDQLLEQIAARQAAGTQSGGGSGIGVAPGMDMYAF